MKLIIDSDKLSVEQITESFNNAAADQFETLPVSVSELPCFGPLRAYGRLVGSKGADGNWSVKEEFFYGQGATIPENPQIEKSGKSWDGVSAQEVASLAKQHPTRPHEGGFFDF